MNTHDDITAKAVWTDENTVTVTTRGHSVGITFPAAPAPTTDEDDSVDFHAMWWKAEREREKAEARVRELESLTAREHLDAAWSAAHVPADGIIPAGWQFIRRWSKGEEVTYGTSGGVEADQPNRGWNIELRLLDPPTPKRPEGAEAAQQYLDGFLSSVEFARDIDTGWLADHLIETLNDSGVRVTEDGEDK